MIEHLLSFHPEDILQFFVTCYLFYAALKLSITAIGNSTRDDLSDNERSHNYEHVTFSLMATLGSFALMFAYGANIILEAGIGAGFHLPAAIQDIVCMSDTIFEIFMLGGFAWAIRHMKQEECENGEFHEDVYKK